MTKLSVNVNKLATLRNARGKNNPNVVHMAVDIMKWGAQGITVHPRPDQRHIRKADVYALQKEVESFNALYGGRAMVEFNIEGYPSADFLQLIEDIKPHQCTLVPDPPDVLTSNAGWNFVEQEAFLTETVKKIQSFGVRCSLFLDPQDFTSSHQAETQKQALSRIAPERVELYTEWYADNYATSNRSSVLRAYTQLSKELVALGLGINAGHDLNQENLGILIKSIPQIEEVSIGHALICEALYQGLEMTVRSYLAILSTPATDFA